jgi:hypothetical protein
VTLACPGFNNNNDYDRQTPCDQDLLRQFAHDAKADLLHAWFNRQRTRAQRKAEAATAVSPASTPTTPTAGPQTLLGLGRGLLSWSQCPVPINGRGEPRAR